MIRFKSWPNSMNSVPLVCGAMAARAGSLISVTACGYPLKQLRGGSKDPPRQCFGEGPRKGPPFHRRPAGGRRRSGGVAVLVRNVPEELVEAGAELEVALVLDGRADVLAARLALRPVFGGGAVGGDGDRHPRSSEGHTYELQSLMRISYA